VNGPLKSAWVLTAFVVVAGAVLWAVTGRAVFAVFIGLGVLTAVGAWFTGRAAPKPAPRKAGTEPAATKEETP
jgi:hypothetical protein